MIATQTTATCQLSMAPVRALPSHTSEMVSMLLFGESVAIVASESDWYRIVCLYDGYEGWVNKKMLIETEHIDANPELSSFFPLISALDMQGYPIWIPYGASLPNMKPDGYFSMGSETYHIIQWENKPTLSDIQTTACSYLHTPYLWGGRSVWGIDCSGLVQMVFKMHGVVMKRDAYQQANQGETIVFRSESQPGDLAFFDNEDGRITHVGIMLEPNRIIHAHGKVRIDVIDDYGIIHTESKQYSHKLRIIKRVL